MTDPTPAVVAGATALAARHRLRGSSFSLDSLMPTERTWWIRGAQTTVGAAVGAVDIASVLTAHQRVVGPHGLTRKCTCGVDLGQVGELTTHQADVLTTTILGETP